MKPPTKTALRRAETHRPYTPAEALAEFRYACETWFSCMAPHERRAAVDFAIGAENTIEFAPKLRPS